MATRGVSAIKDVKSGDAISAFPETQAGVSARDIMDKNEERHSSNPFQTGPGLQCGGSEEGITAEVENEFPSINGGEGVVNAHPHIAPT